MSGWPGRVVMRRLEFGGLGWEGFRTKFELASRHLPPKTISKHHLFSLSTIPDSVSRHRVLRKYEQRMQPFTPFRSPPNNVLKKLCISTIPFRKSQVYL